MDYNQSLPESDLITAIRDLNPGWSDNSWRGSTFERRDAFYSAMRNLHLLGQQRAIYLRGFRGVGKSTILRQIADWLHHELRVPAKNITYINFEKRPLRQLQWQTWWRVWLQYFKPLEGPVYFLFDEIQYSQDWVQEIRSLIGDDRFRVVVTGSSAAEIQASLDEEIRRWVSLRIPPLSFHEYLRLFRVQEFSRLQTSEFQSLLLPITEKTDWNVLRRAFDILESSFKEYLLRGGFPEIANARLPLSEGQRLLTDVVDKALYQDMRNQFSQHDIGNLNRLIEFVARSPGLLLDKTNAAASLEVSRPTIARYVKALIDGDFIIELRNENRGGKKALKSKPKLYIADASMRNALLARTASVFSVPDEMGFLSEEVLAGHLSVYANSLNGTFGYWRKNDKEEIDFMVKTPDERDWILESKSGSLKHKMAKAVNRWSKSARERLDVCFLLTRFADDMGARPLPQDWPSSCPIYAVPTSVFLYLLGQDTIRQRLPLEQKNDQTKATAIEPTLDPLQASTGNSADIVSEVTLENHQWK